MFAILKPLASVFGGGYRARRALQFGVVFIVGSLLGVLGNQLVAMHVDVQMRTTAKGSLQYFYDTGAGFNETQSRCIQHVDSAIFTHYAASMPAKSLRSIRVDPATTQGKFEIRSLSIDYLFWHHQWNGHSELKYLVPSNEIEVNSTEGPVLIAQSVGNDPSFVTRDVEYLKHWQLIANIISAMIGGIIAILIFVAVRYYGGINAVLANGHTALIIIVIAGALLRIGYWIDSALPSEPSQMGSVHSDEGTYFSIAQYIMTNGVRDYLFAEQSVMTAPGNPIYIALMYALTNSVNTIRGMNIFLSLLTIILVFKLGERTYNKSVGLLAAAICAVHVQLIQCSATLLTEPLFLCIFIAGIYLLVLALDTQNQTQPPYQRIALTSGLFLTIAILTRAVAMLLPIFLLGVIGTVEAYRSWQGGKASFPLLKRAALPLILPLIIVGIVATKNYVFFDRVTVATGSGAALWLGSRADTEGDEPPLRGRTYDTQNITNGASHISVAGDKLLIEAAKNNILGNPLGYAWWSVKKIGRLLVGSNLAWFYPNKNISDWYRATGRDVRATANITFQIILASSIVVYGIIGLWAVRRQGSLVLVSSATACYLLIFSIPFLAIQRYGLPLTIILAAPASAVMYGAWHEVARLRRAAFVGAIFISAIVLQIFFLG